MVASRRLSVELELKASTIRAEIADHDGYYKKAAGFLADYDWVSADLKDVQHQGKSAFVFQGKSDEWWLIRQKVFYQWKRSVAAYRALGGFEESRHPAAHSAGDC